MKILKILTVLFLAFIALTQATSVEAKPLVKKSFISEDATLNMLAFFPQDFISLKDEKNVFTSKDKKVTWSAYTGDMSINTKKSFKVYWYGPDGKLIETTIPKNVCMESSNIKSSISTKDKHVGLYKVAIVFKDTSIIDEKYFKISESPSDTIKQDEIKHFESVLDKSLSRKLQAKKEPELEKPSRKESMKKMEEEKKSIRTPETSAPKPTRVPSAAPLSTASEIEIAKRIKPKGKFPVFTNATLSDLKNLYIDFEAEYDKDFKAPKKFEEIRNKYREKFGKKVEEKLGFNVVDNIGEADAVLNLRLRAASYDFLGCWAAYWAYAEFMVPGTNFLIKDFVAISNNSGNHILVGFLEGDLIKKIKKDLEEGHTKFSTTPDGRVIRIIPDRKEYIVDDGRIIYTKKEKIDRNLCPDPLLPLDKLPVKGYAGSPRSIAILVYHTSYIGNLGDKPEERMEKLFKNMENHGLLMEKFRDRGDLHYTYGYLVRLDYKRQKYYISALQKRFLSVSDKSFSAEKLAGKERVNFPFWRDMSFVLSERVSDYFIKNGYKVINLTPARLDFSKKTPEEVVATVSGLYDIDEVMIVPYTALTKWQWRDYDTRHYRVGLLLAYASYIFEKGNKKPVFEFAENLKPIAEKENTLYGVRTRFHSFVEDDNGKIMALCDGIIDDGWVVSRLLKKFSGQEKGITEKVRVGGDLFEELSNQGF